MQAHAAERRAPRFPCEPACMQAVTKEEPRWHAAIAVLVALALYVTLPPRIIVGPLWLAPLLVLLIMVPLNVISPQRHQEAPWQRLLSVATIAILNAFNVGTIFTLFADLLGRRPHVQITGELLLLAAVEIWLTNVIVYALWFWEVDGGGPDARAHASSDSLPLQGYFLFPQMALAPDLRERMRWRPRFIDYVFLSFTNATAFSPTDTFPLTSLAKVLMMAEARTSLVAIAVIAGRAINILGS